MKLRVELGLHFLHPHESLTECFLPLLNIVLEVFNALVETLVLTADTFDVSVVGPLIATSRVAGQKRGDEIVDRLRNSFVSAGLLSVRIVGGCARLIKQGLNLVRFVLERIK